MKTIKEHAIELLNALSDAAMQENKQLFIDKITDVLIYIAIGEVKELMEIRNVSNDKDAMSILIEQRKKYSSICKIVNGVDPNLLPITDFDEMIKKIIPKAYDLYVYNVLELDITT